MANSDCLMRMWLFQRKFGLPYKNYDTGLIILLYRNEIIESQKIDKKIMDLKYMVLKIYRKQNYRILKSKDGISKEPFIKYVPSLFELFGELYGKESTNIDAENIAQ